MQTIINYHY